MRVKAFRERALSRNSKFEGGFGHLEPLNVLRRILSFSSFSGSQCFSGLKNVDLAWPPWTLGSRYETFEEIHVGGCQFFRRETLGLLFGELGCGEEVVFVMT